jgi:gliding motility-associated-like protein
MVTLGNCSASDTILIDQVDSVVLDLGSDLSICEGEEAVFSTDVEADQFIWNSGEATPSITVSTSGVYELTVEIDGCDFSESVSLDVVTLPVINLGVDTQMCQGETLVLDASPFGDSCTWQDGYSGVTYTVSESGLYAVEVIQNGCVGTDEISVIVNPIPSFELGPNVVICHNENAQIEAFTSNSDALITWSNGESTSAIFPIVTGTYSATAYLNGCVFSDEIYVEVIPTFNISLGEDIVLCDEFGFTLDARDESFIYPLQFTWNDGVNDGIREVTGTGLYQVEVVSACESKLDEIHVKFELCDCRIFVPSAFTPDNDGFNDVFRVSTSKCDFERYNLWIMDRNGDVVFTSDSPNNIWDGSFKQGAHYVKNGIYVWRMIYTRRDNEGVKAVDKFGHITIIR